MKGKKLISIFAVMALIAALLTTSAFALGENRADTSSSYAGTSSAEAGERTENSEKLWAYLEELMERKSEAENGETVRKDVLSDGTVLYVVPIDEEETPPQGGRFPRD